MIVLAIIVTFFILTFKLIKNGPYDLLSLIALFYAFFSFGPIFNYLLDLPIYFGIIEEHIPRAAWIFTTGIITIVCFSLLVKQKTLPETKDLLNQKNYFFEFPFIKIIIHICIAISIYKILQMSLLNPGLNKVQKLAIANPRFHYPYLILQTYLACFYFFIHNKKLYWLNFLTYITYCLVIGERDFIFLLASLYLHKVILEKKKMSWTKLITMSTPLILVGTIMFFVRDETQSTDNALGALLNQGSLLFINTYIIDLLDYKINFMYGKTYINTLLNLLPSWIYKTDFNTLEWFKNLYAPDGDSGYGFGLDAEGYLNFGWPGVILMFTTLCAIQRFLFNNIPKSPIFLYLSLFYTNFVMYSLRNDTLALVKGNLYAIIFYVLMRMVSNFMLTLTPQQKHSSKGSL